MKARSRRPETQDGIETWHLTNRHTERWDIENESRLLLPLIPSIALTDYWLRFFSIVFSCLVYNLWRVVDYSLKDLAAEAFDDYVRGPTKTVFPHCCRFGTVLARAAV